MDRIKNILEFWFEGLKKPTKESIAARGKVWFSKDDEYDKKLKKNFEKDLVQAASGKLERWKSTPHGMLAVILLFDQVSRNIYRGTKASFEYDAKALKMAKKGIQDGVLEKLTPFEIQFFAMPLMHSENLEDQNACIEVFENVISEQEDGAIKDYFKGSLDFAKEHLKIIERFQRFPHRNEILGRESTPEEVSFLSGPGSSF